MDQLVLWGFEGCGWCLCGFAACTGMASPDLFSIGFVGFGMMCPVSQRLLRRSWCHFVNLHKWVVPLAVWREIVTWFDPVLLNLWRERDVDVMQLPSL